MYDGSEDVVQVYTIAMNYSGVAILQLHQLPRVRNSTGGFGQRNPKAIHRDSSPVHTKLLKGSIPVKAKRLKQA